jgi:hypothetical protein
MVYCPACGTANTDDAAYCSKCGRSLTDVKEMRAGVEPQSATLRIDDEGLPLGADGLPPGADVDGVPGGERFLWKGRPSFIASPILSIKNRYELTNERLKVARGFISRHRQEIDLYRVEDVEVKQGPVQRMLDIGHIYLYSSDASTPMYTLYDIPHPESVKDMVRRGSRLERDRRRVILRDEV